MRLVNIAGLCLGLAFGVQLTGVPMAHADDTPCTTGKGYPAIIGGPTAGREVTKRIFSLTKGSWAKSGLVSYRTLLDDLKLSDVVFLGEYHDDPGTHAMEMDFFDRLYDARSGNIVLSLEMFERDVQRELDAYLAGDITEEEFLAASRPWPNYATDYRPLIEYAKNHHVPVIAANIPRPLASRVAKLGIDAAWTGYTPEERRWVAATTEHPQDAYWGLFSGMMGHGMGMDEATVMNYYAAQCIKDDTMAEAISSAHAEYPGALVLHVNGSFHSDYHLGTVSRVAERVPTARISVVALRPVTSFSGLNPREENLPEEALALHTGGLLDDGTVPVADYIMFVPAPAPVVEETSVETEMPPAEDSAQKPEPPPGMPGADESGEQEQP